jgi:hypothetical protein
MLYAVVSSQPDIFINNESKRTTTAKTIISTEITTIAINAFNENFL